MGLLCSSYSNSQTTDPTTGNLINSGTSPTDTTSIWNNGVYVNQLCFGAGQPGNCGPNPSIRDGGSTINFSYGQTDLNQIVNINRALAAGGSGVQLSGFNFGFMAKNGNHWDDARQDYLAAYVKFYNAGGGLAANYDYSAQTDRKYNWTQFNFNETFASPIAASNYSNAQVGFVGRDNNFWAGNYGPEIYNVSFNLKYRVDPCSTNPAYSSTCAGFGDVINSRNLLNSSVGGGSLNQVFAVNTALGLAGSGAMVHGFNYGFNYSVGQGFNGCTAWNQDGSCSWTMNIPAYVSAAATFTNSNNQVIKQQTYSFSQEGTSGSVSEKYLLPSSMNQTLLGTGRVQGNASGSGSSITGAWANIIYTADPCAVDPLSSPSCKGYAVAYAKTLVLGSTVSNASAPSGPPGMQFGGNGPLRGEGPGPGSEGPGNGPMAGGGPQQQDRVGPGPMAGGDGSGRGDGSMADGPGPGGGPGGGPSGGPGGGNGPGPLGSNAPQQAQSGPSNANDGPKMTPGAALSVARAAQEKDKAVQATAVQAAAKAFENVVQSSNTASNAAVNMNQDMSANSATAAAQFSSQTTQASQQTMTQSTQTQITTQQASSVQSQTSRTTQTTQQTASGTGLTVTGNPFAYNPLGSFTASNLLAPTVQTAPVYQPRLEARPVEMEAPPTQVASFGGMGRAGNPLSDMMVPPRFEMMQENTQQQTGAVNRNVQPNDLAGGVDIASMATIPVGFSAYSIVLRDTAFYEPKEIYKAQRVVDNVRVLRQMSSDSLHKQMVDSQYKLGN